MGNLAASNKLRLIPALVMLVLIPLNAQGFTQQAQGAYKPPVDPAQRPKFRAMVDTINQRARELGLISVSDDADMEAFVQRRKDAQLREDFEKLHSIGTETLAALSSAPSLDLKSLTDAAADLKNRATRIKSNVRILQIADRTEKIRYEEYPDCLTSMVPELSRLVGSFLGSPIFRFSSPNDAELRLKASRELDAIIKLSETINRVAKRSPKAAPSK